MLLIYETPNFEIKAADRPFIDRTEGGHIYIFPKTPVRDRTKLSPELAVEYMKLSMVVGEALKSAMARRGVDIGIVNYQDMGNWGVFKPEGPTLHMQIYGRATTATIQKYGDAVQLPHRESGFYDHFKPLDEDDVKEIRIDIEKLMKTDKYQDAWTESGRMSNNAWSDLHKNYQAQDWIDKPSLFAETAIKYFPASGKILDLGAGQGQDSRFFAERGYEVVSTDLEEAALEQSRSKLADNLKAKVTIRKIDLRERLPFESASFDIVYAHLSLHYFDHQTTARLFEEIHRILKPGGVLAFFTNSTRDPEYGTGKKLEDDYFQIDQVAKRYFTVDTARAFARDFKASLLDDQGETYKDRAKGIHNLIRFIGIVAH